MDFFLLFLFALWFHVLLMFAVRFCFYVLSLVRCIEVYRCPAIHNLFLIIEFTLEATYLSLFFIFLEFIDRHNGTTLLGFEYMIGIKAANLGTASNPWYSECILK